MSDFQTKECPYCAHSFSTTKKNFSFKEFSSQHNVHMMQSIQQLSKTNQFAAGVLAAFNGLNQMGVLRVYLCPKCHLPFL